MPDNNTATKYKCNKCGRKVHQTTHSVEEAKVDYFITDSTVGEEPVVTCVECYRKR